MSGEVAIHVGTVRSGSSSPEGTQFSFLMEETDENLVKKSGEDTDKERYVPANRVRAVPTVYQARAFPYVTDRVTIQRARDRAAADSAPACWA